MNGQELAQFIDHSVLRPDTRLRDVDEACDAALVYRFRGVVVPSGSVAHAKRRLMNSGIKVVSTCAFPHGNCAPDMKAHEAMRASAMGADEIDYVISVGAALDGDWKYLQEEALAIVRQTRGKILKAILETGYLHPPQIVEAAKAVVAAGVAYVKTSTGYGPSGATVEHVRLLADALHGKAMVKAAGGVRDRAHAEELLAAGASVIGTGRGPLLCSE